MPGAMDSSRLPAFWGIAFTLLAEYMPAHGGTRAELVVGILAIVPGYAFAAISVHFLLPIAGWTCRGAEARIEFAEGMSESIGDIPLLKDCVCSGALSTAGALLQTGFSGFSSGSFRSPVLSGYPRR